MALALRPYQTEAIAAVQTDVAAGKRRLLIHLPVGAGKTVVFATLARQWAQPTLVLVHREELLQQAVEKFHMVWPEVPVGIVRGAQQTLDTPVVVATVQTLARRLDRITPDQFRLAIVDEAHHAAASQWRAVLRATGFWPRPRPHHCLVGVTATIDRTDGVDLGALFETTSYQLPMLTLIQQGYLANLRAIRVRTALDLDSVPDRDGDWDPEALARIVDTPARNALVVQQWQAHAAGRQATLVFAASVAHAEHLADAFLRAGIRAAWIAGTHSPTERKARLEAFHQGAIRVLVNVAILTEGYDEPRVDCVVLARPTQSAVVYTQAIGRGTRRHPGKRDCLVLDIADNSSRHALCTVGQVVGLPDALLDVWSVAEVASHASRRDPRAEGPAVGQDPAIAVGVTAESERVDLFDQSVFRWESEGRRYTLPAGPGQWLTLVHRFDDPDHYDVVLRAAGTTTTLADALPLDFALGTAEDWVRTHGRPDLADKQAPWRREPATAQERAEAARLGIPLPSDATREYAQDRIRSVRREQVLHDPQAPWRSQPASARTRAFLDRLNIAYAPDITAGDAADRIHTALNRRKAPGRKEG